MGRNHSLCSEGSGGISRWQSVPMSTEHGCRSGRQSHTAGWRTQMMTAKSSTPRKLLFSFETRAAEDVGDQENWDGLTSRRARVDTTAAQRRVVLVPVSTRAKKERGGKREEGGKKRRIKKQKIGAIQYLQPQSQRRYATRRRKREEWEETFTTLVYFSPCFSSLSSPFFPSFIFSNVYCIRLLYEFYSSYSFFATNK